MNKEKFDELLIKIIKDLNHKQVVPLNIELELSSQVLTVGNNAPYMLECIGHDDTVYVIDSFLINYSQEAAIGYQKINSSEFTSHAKTIYRYNITLTGWTIYSQKEVKRMKLFNEYNAIDIGPYITGITYQTDQQHFMQWDTTSSENLLENPNISLKNKILNFIKKLKRKIF